MIMSQGNSLWSAGALLHLYIWGCGTMSNPPLKKQV